jgi:hypothetical protein
LIILFFHTSWSWGTKLQYIWSGSLNPAPSAKRSVGAAWVPVPRRPPLAAGGEGAAALSSLLFPLFVCQFLKGATGDWMPGTESPA